MSRASDIQTDGITPSAADTVTLQQPVTSVAPGRQRSASTIYARPYSMYESDHDWPRLWTNTAVLGGAYIGTLLVLECLPEDATTWNRAELQKRPLFKRWHDHVIRKGPEWDHDRFLFNYILHPYAGATYFMAARSCGFNFAQSLLYCTCVSTIGWEFGIESFMERPSYQDLFITPLVGSILGEQFYRLKRRIVGNGYTLGGSAFLGNLVVFLIDPVNEVIDLIRGSKTRGLFRKGGGAEIQTSMVPSAIGYSQLAISIRF